jgi:alpha-tubulin suppressor-like RCC1 family protein
MPGTLPRSGGTIVRASAALAFAAIVFAESAAANPAVSGLTQIAPGGYHTCAVTAGGGAQCWGWNGYGQLGTGVSADSTVAIDVAGLAAGVVAVTTGSRHSCALMAAGTVKCWGDNFYGQLGGGPPLPSNVPVDVAGLVGIVAISAGSVHTCGLTATGGVVCWGNDSWGQLGGNNLGSGIVAIESGYQHACALTSGGAVKCWGANYGGQLGIGFISTNSAVPVDVSGLSSGVIAIGAGSVHSCAVVAGGGVKCWGTNNVGQLGDGSTTNSLVPVDVQALSGVSTLALGEGHSCALTTADGVKCWGSAVVNGTTSNASVPVDVIGLAAAVTAIASGEYHSCALVAGGAARCWGANSFGGLGNGIAGRFARPVDVIGLAGIAAIATGTDHSCALTSAGVVGCWGRNLYGALGNGTLDDAFIPVDVAVGTPAIVIRAGGHASCAVSWNGAVKCWGQLGDALPQPTDVPGLGSGVVDVALGNGFACALTSAGGVKCWGGNHAGQLGNGSTMPSATPVDVVGLASNVVAINAGDGHACAILGDGAVRCWGANHSGQVTASPGTMETTPVVVTALADAALGIDGGGSHTCVQTTSYAMRCWGLNSNAQFGLGHQHALSGVFTVPLGTGTLALATGLFHSCQIGGGGTVRCWGQNNEGQIGSGTPMPFGESSPLPVMSPTQVTGLAGATAISASGQHTCVIVDGGVKCWGNNSNGQLGNGVGGYASTPQIVLGGLCGGFDDVFAGSAFCANVEWNRNRLVTLGCAPGLFCPDEAVSRLAMAAFVNRLGSALTPVVVAAQDTPGAIDPADFVVICTTAEYQTGTQRRRVYVDGVLRALSPADFSLAFRLVASEAGGAWFGNFANDHGGTRAGLWSNHRVHAHFDVAENQNVRFGIQVSRGLLPPGPALSDSSCSLRARIDNRNGP